ncbi:MAG: hypothetical protein PVF33_08840 [Candidatus Latescibacterota bacterium]|jgi:hypothetical protein
MMGTRLILTAVIVVFGFLESLAIPALVPVARNGVVSDPATGRPLAGVLITVRELPDTVGNCTETDTPATFTGPGGEYELELGCPADVTFAKPGCETLKLRWPQQLAATDACGCCPELRPVELKRSTPESLPRWIRSFGYDIEAVHSITVGDFGYPYVPVQIDSSTCLLALDTGNTVGVTVNAAVFDRLNLKNTGTWVRLSGSGEVVATPRLGEAGAVSALGYERGPEMIYESGDNDPSGLIGPEFVTGGRFTLDYESRLIAVSPDPVPGPVGGFHAVPMVRSAVHPTLILVYGKVEGRRVLIELDTGKSRTVVNPDLAASLGLEENARGVRIHDIGIGNLSFEVPRAKPVDQTDIETGSPGPILAGVGSDVLSRIVWTVDYKSGVLWLPDSR